MSEYWISESTYNLLRENLAFILVGILLLLFAISCSCLFGGSKENER